MNIREIARLAGCSPATISRVFNRTPGVSKELSQKILKIAAERHYHPRITEKQKNVVLITPYNSVYPVQSCIDMLLMAVTQELPKQGYRVEILPVNSAERLSDIRFCAAVGIGLEHSVFPDWEQRFDAPLIFLDRSPQKPLRSDGNVFFVNSDEQMGVKLALEHLRERKCRKVGCIIHGNPGEGNASIRHAAILSTLKKLNFPCEESLIHFSGNGSDRYVELVGKLLRHGIDALFCPGGNAGITVLYALSLYNRQVPGDISLIASEQSFFSNYATPPQTTVTQEYSLLAQKVVEVISARIAGSPVPSVTTLPYRLIRRESVR